MKKEKLYFFVGEEDTFHLRFRYLYLIRELLNTFEVKLIVREVPELYDALKNSEFVNLQGFSFFEAGEIWRRIDRAAKNSYLESVKNLLKDFKVRIENLEVDIWKLIVLDDLAASVAERSNELPEFGDDVSAIISPLFHPNSYSGKDAYYHLALYKTAKEKNIPVIGVELTALSNEYYYHYHFYDFFAVKSERSKKILIEKVGISEERIFLLKKKYSTILTASELSPTAIIRTFENLEHFHEEIYNGDPVITIVHSLSERYSFRKTLRALSMLDNNYSTVAVSNQNAFVISLKEREVLEKAYLDELTKLKRKEYFILDTPYTSVEFLSLFSDYIIYVDNSMVGAYSCLPENVLVLNPFEKFSEEQRFFKNEFQLSEFLNKELQKDTNHKTLKEVLHSVIGERNEPKK